MGWPKPDKAKDYSVKITLEVVEQLVHEVHYALSASSTSPKTCADYLRTVLLVLQKVKLEILQEMIADTEDIVESLEYPVGVRENSESSTLHPG